MFCLRPTHISERVFFVSLIIINERNHWIVGTPLKWLALVLRSWLKWFLDSLTMIHSFVAYFMVIDDWFIISLHDCTWYKIFGKTQYNRLEFYDWIGSIVLDTINLSPAAQRATPKDVKLVGELEECLSKTLGTKAPNRGDIFNALVKARSDISQLTTEQLLRKDCKLLKTPEITIAIPAVPLLSQVRINFEFTNNQHPVICISTLPCQCFGI